MRAHRLSLLFRTELVGIDYVGELEYIRIKMKFIKYFIYLSKYIKAVDVHVRTALA